LAVSAPQQYEQIESRFDSPKSKPADAPKDKAAKARKPASRGGFDNQAKKGFVDAMRKWGDLETRLDKMLSEVDIEEHSPPSPNRSPLLHSASRMPAGFLSEL